MSTLFYSEVFFGDIDIQNVPGGKVNILGGHSIGHSKQKNCICTCVLFGTVSEIDSNVHHTRVKNNNIRKGREQHTNRKK
jgi:hypothetical protein